MSAPLRPIAERIVLMTGFFSALWHFAWAIGLAGLGIWLWFAFDDWIGIVGPAVAAFFSISLVVDTCLIYLSVFPAQRPDERERYLRAHSLYNPDDQFRRAQRDRQNQ